MSEGGGVVYIGPITPGNVAKWAHENVLQDGGAAGTGDVSAVPTPTNGHVAVWVGPTTIADGGPLPTGNVTSVPTPTPGHLAVWATPTSIQDGGVPATGNVVVVPAVAIGHLAVWAGPNAIQDGGVPAPTFDQSLNKADSPQFAKLGIGTVPPAWGVNYPTVSAGLGGAFGGSKSSGAAFVYNNLYYDGTNYRYLLADAGAILQMGAGALTWFSAPVGVAGAVATPVVQMQLDLAGNLTTAGTVKGSTLAVPTQTVLNTVGSGTYNTKPNCRQLRIRMIAGGGGGMGAAVNALSPNSGANGTATVFGPTTVNPGITGVAYANRPGGTGGAGPATLRIQGGQGSGGGVWAGANPTQTQMTGMLGGTGPFGGNGGGQNSSDGGSASPNTGAGGAGGAYCDNGGGGQHMSWGGSGSAGEYAEAIINTPAASYAYTVGDGGAGGIGPASNGGKGGSGVIIIDEIY